MCKVKWHSPTQCWSMLAQSVCTLYSQGAKWKFQHIVGSAKCKLQGEMAINVCASLNVFSEEQWVYIRVHVYWEASETSKLRSIVYVLCILCICYVYIIRKHIILYIVYMLCLYCVYIRLHVCWRASKTTKRIILYIVCILYVYCVNIV